ncbi:MAG: TraR/DksA C4-type zinc finger protein [Burkholderiaceae bacterium]|nr:TraR/DksA C4-type zinc finger protein [Burkholderiaceae bacterium]
MQTTTSLWTDRHAPTSGPHEPLLDEPLRGLLQHRLDDLERRLIDMSRTMDALLRQSRGSGTDDTDGTSAMNRPHPELPALAEVRAARARLEAGSYGLCATCDAPIERHRLAGRPQVLHCGFCEQQSSRR